MQGTSVCKVLVCVCVHALLSIYMYMVRRMQYQFNGSDKQAQPSLVPGAHFDSQR